MARDRELLEFDATASGKAEREAFLKQFQEFTFNEDQREPLMITLQGTEGTGKTHAYSQLVELGEPIYVTDTELRARKVAQKKFGIKNIQHCTTWEETVIWATYVMKKCAPGWFVFDSITDIVTFSERRVLTELDRDKIGKGIYWGPVYEKVDKLISLLKEKGFSIVATSRMKDEYVNEARTGKLKPAVYSRIPYQSDLVVQFNRDGSRSIEKPLFDGKISKINYTMETSLADVVRMFD